jgi:CRP-like cAMP-binding protein
MSFNALNLLEPTAVKVLSRADQIPVQPDVLWEIQRGIVKTQTWTEAGKVITLGYWGVGDVVGTPLMAIDPYEMFCITPVMVRGLDPHHASALPFLYQQVKTLQKLTWILRQASVAERLWSLLLWLFERFGYTVQEGCLIDIRLTHQDLAELADTSRVTVTRLLKQFEAQRLLCRRNKHYVLLTLEPDLLKLQSLALGKESTVQKTLGCDKKS